LPDTSDSIPQGSQSANAPGKHRQDQIVTRVGQRLHQNFRKTYINIKYISLANRENKTEESKKPSLWSTVAFDFQKHCLFCGMLSLVTSDSIPQNKQCFWKSNATVDHKLGFLLSSVLFSRFAKLIYFILM
jgi:hypothetical protein